MSLQPLTFALQNLTLIGQAGTFRVVTMATYAQTYDKFAAALTEALKYVSKDELGVGIGECFFRFLGRCLTLCAQKRGLVRFFLILFSSSFSSSPLPPLSSSFFSL